MLTVADMGEGGVKNGQKSADVLYGLPLSKNTCLMRIWGLELKNRRRPAQNINDNFLEVSVDKFSFPSGHATRAILLAIFFTYLYPLPLLLFVPVGECFVYQLV